MEIRNLLLDRALDGALKGFYGVQAQQTRHCYERAPVNPVSLRHLAINMTENCDEDGVPCPDRCFVAAAPQHDSVAVASASLLRKSASESRFTSSPC